MAVIRYKNQCDYAFLVWMNEFPNSTHPLDEQRFMVFAKTVAVYRARKWLDFSYFKLRMENHPSYFDEEKLTPYWERLRDFVEFHKTSQIPVAGHGGQEEDYGYYQVGTDGNDIYKASITQQEYLDGGINLQEVRRRVA